jgi:hypothetical protein
LNEIRYFEYSSDDDSEGKRNVNEISKGWVLMTDNFSTSVENKTRIKLKLRKGEKSNRDIFKRSPESIQHFQLEGE